ncbi:polyamine N-acetyltransferase 1 [Trichomonascus vanleenenianus]|uniref:polyamine acetyltransferase n=1 Tax=Trichomonascus vanleenenianus TaxID=2268995 RepID=UPI003EC9714E
MTNDLPAHAVIRPLNKGDIDQCVRLEYASFSEAERASRETVLYRITVAPELCAGVFIREFADTTKEGENEDAKTEAETPTVADNSIEDRDEDYEDIEDSEDEDHKLPPGKSLLVSERLIGHVLATKIAGDWVTDESMMRPELDEYNRSVKGDTRGHHEHGRTIAIHSVCVDKEFQGRSIGTIMLRDYIQRITVQHIADRMALLAHEELMPFYQRFGFEDSGPSSCKHGQGDFHAMWCPLSDEDEEE